MKLSYKLSSPVSNTLKRRMDHESIFRGGSYYYDLDLSLKWITDSRYYILSVNSQLRKKVCVSMTNTKRHQGTNYTKDKATCYDHH